MKKPLLLISILLLAGCGTIDQMSYGSWLERVGRPEQARYPFTPDEVQARRLKAEGLHAQADVLRAKLAGEKDRVQRVAYLHQLNDIGAELTPIEKELRAGGTSGRRYPAPADYTQAGGH